MDAKSQELDASVVLKAHDIIEGCIVNSSLNAQNIAGITDQVVQNVRPAGAYFITILSAESEPWCSKNMMHMACPKRPIIRSEWAQALELEILRIQEQSLANQEHSVFRSHVCLTLLQGQRSVQNPHCFSETLVICNRML